MYKKLSCFEKNHKFFYHSDIKREFFIGLFHSLFGIKITFISSEIIIMLLKRIMSYNIIKRENTARKNLTIQKSQADT